MNNIKTKLNKIDYKNLSYSDYQLMYDLLLIDNPNIGANPEFVTIKFQEVYGINIDERMVMSLQDVSLNTEIEDLKLYYNK